MVQKLDKTESREAHDGYRAFIALDLPESVKKILFESVSPVMKKLRSQVKWVALENFHLTLRFIGDISNSTSELLRESMRNIIPKYDEVEFEIKSPGVFPSWKEPRVLWIGLNPTRGDLIGLQRKLEELVQSVGYSPEKQRFHPHITIGRVKDTSSSVGKIWGTVMIPQVPNFVISKVTLFRSTLLPSGAVYDKVEEFLLGKVEK